MSALSSSTQKKDTLSDIKNLMALINDGNVGYWSAAAATDIPELKILFIHLSLRRRTFSDDLKKYMTAYAEGIAYGDGGLLDGLSRAKLSVQQSALGITNTRIIETIIFNERAVIQRYEESISGFQDQAEYISLLKNQRNDLQVNLARIVIKRIWYNGLLIK